MTTPRLRSSWQFFRTNSGYVVGENALSAWALAKAEETIQGSSCYRFYWTPDLDPDLSWMTAEERAQDHDVMVAILEKCCDHCGSWHVVASLGGIVDATADYERVVESELALEVTS